MALLPTNKRDQIMLGICVLALGLAYAFYQYVWTPKGEELNTLQERVEKLHDLNETVRAEIARGTAGRLRDEADMFGRMLILMRQLVPLSNEVPALLEQISNAARQTGLEIGAITPLGFVPGEVFETHRYNLSVTGPYHRIGQFLDNVGSLTRIMAPMNLVLRPSNRAGIRLNPGEALLDASFEIQTYVMKAPTRSAATPAAGGQ